MRQNLQLSIGIAICFLLNIGRAQSPVVRATDQAGGGTKFDCADIHSSPRIPEPILRGPFFGDGRYELRFATMLDLIRLAYNLDPERVVGGPSWLEWDRYDILATVPPGASAESRWRMLRSLLADRFHLALHEDTRPIPVWALTASTSKRMSAADDSGETGCRFTCRMPSLQEMLPLSSRRRLLRAFSIIAAAM